MSIKANELRVGNFLDVFGECEVTSVYGDEQCIKVKRPSNSGGYLIEKAPLNSLDVKAIPITEEWLLRFGFNKHNNGYFWINWGRNGVEFVSLHPGYNLFGLQLGKVKIKILNYIHELQNIFFSVTEH